MATTMGYLDRLGTTDARDFLFAILTNTRKKE